MAQTKTILAWLVFFNWPLLAIWVPYIGSLFFFPLLFWINIPALWFGLAEAVGYPHYDIQEFGALPNTLFAWLINFLFWTLVATVMTGLTAVIRAMFGHNENRDDAAERSKESLHRLQDSLRQ